MTNGEVALVTGAAGFIGSRLAQRLLRDGHVVHGIALYEPRDGMDGVRWRRGNVADNWFVHRVVREVRPSVIFHLASLVSGSRDMNRVLPTFHSNLTSTVNVLTAASQIECHRVVIAGSMEEPRTDEDFPVSPYAAAKGASTAYARMFHQLYGVPAVVLRLHMVYGPGQIDFHKLVPYVVRALLKNETPTLTSGERSVDWVYVDDVVEAMVAAAKRPEPVGEVIDIGSGRLVTIRDFVERICSRIATDAMPDFGTRNDRPFEIERAADTRHGEKLLGWRATTDIDEGITKTIRWYREILPAMPRDFIPNA